MATVKISAESESSCSFVLTTSESGRNRGFHKNGKRAISVGDIILVFESEIL